MSIRALFMAARGGDVTAAAELLEKQPLEEYSIPFTRVNARASSYRPFHPPTEIPRPYRPPARLNQPAGRGRAHKRSHLPQRDDSLCHLACLLMVILLL